MANSKDTRNYFSISETAQQNLRNDLQCLFLIFSGDASLIAENTQFIISKYSEKHRAYHNLSHVNALLFQAENLKEKFADLASVQLTIWFHDVIYNPKRLDNESESARLAVEILAELGALPDKIEKVRQMTLATQKHDAANLDFDGKLFLDLDLSILGQPSEVYQNYASAIRKEYSFVPWFLYRRARRKILENFLKRETIYFTDEIRNTHEATARLNIQEEIKTLS
jgi:predicted metal-dependent HD superfamily phosphohydrolase